MPRLLGTFHGKALMVICNRGVHIGPAWAGSIDYCQYEIYGYTQSLSQTIHTDDPNLKQLFNAFGHKHYIAGVIENHLDDPDNWHVMGTEFGDKTTVLVNYKIDVWFIDATELTGKQLQYDTTTVRRKVIKKSTWAK